MSKREVTWGQVQDFIDEVYEIIKDNLKLYSGVFSFPRGGLVLAVMLSYKTGLPLLSSPAENCIIIDDLIDSGVTMKKYSDLKYDKNYFVATMFMSEDQWEHTAEKYLCDDDFSMYVKKDGEEIVFPWQQKSSKTI